MATKKGGTPNHKARLRLQGMPADQEPGPIEVAAFDRQGKRIAKSVVSGDGGFTISANALKKAHRIKIGPGGDDAQGAPASAFLTYRAVDFAAVLDHGVIDIAEGIWTPWFPFVRCVSGSVLRCRRSWWWYQDLHLAALQTTRVGAIASSSVREATIAGISTGNRLIPGLDIDDLIRWPVRCTKICLGTVEVYRRVCCCEPWVIFDPRLHELIEELEEIVGGLPPIPDGPVPPGPGPDPLPIRDAYFPGGAMDERALRAKQDLHALRTLSPGAIAEYVNVRPYLVCRRYSCSTPVKVAEGTIGPDGRFNICWRSFPTLLRPGCHEEFAYKVKQKFGPFTITIYDGIAADQWYRANEEPVLRSFHPWAVACRDNGGDGDAFVYLDVIGDTGSEHLATPTADSAVSVTAPAANSGVVFPAGGPAGGVGEDRNWGGTLKLQIMFSESMRTIGAKYYRVSVVEADGNGDPTGQRHTITDVRPWTKAVAVVGGVDIVPVGLGPHTAGIHNDLFEIPFDGALGAGEDWEADQYHAYLDTNDSRWNDPTVRHLLTIEVFDAAGGRLRPNGTPATGLPGGETDAAFTFRRKYQAIGSTDMVPFGALTHMFWWDNRDVVATIEDLRMNGLTSSDVCQFLTGDSTSTFGIGYRAYHPEELFQRDHRITWKKGLSGGTGVLLPATHANMGVPPGPPAASPTATFGVMLGSDSKCAFSVFLTTVNKRTDGDDLGYSQRTDSAAFALDVAPTVCPPCECGDGEGDDDGGSGNPGRGRGRGRS